MCINKIMLLPIPRQVAKFAVSQLAYVDYSIANRVTEVVSDVVDFAYDKDIPWLAKYSTELLQVFDDFGSILIAFVIWIVHHTP